MSAAPSHGIPSIAELKRELPRQGFALEAGAKHTKVMRGGQQVAVLPRTKGREAWQAARNSLATLRRAGFEWPPLEEERNGSTPDPQVSPEVERLRQRIHGDSDVAVVAGALGVRPHQVVAWLAGSLPSQSEAARIDRYLAAEVSEEPARKFDNRAYLAALDVTYGEYALLRPARRHLDREALAEAMMAMAGAGAPEASEQAGLERSMVSRMRRGKGYPNFPTLAKMLRFADQPLAAFVPEAMRDGLPHWPKDVAPLASAEEMAAEEDVPFGAPPEPADIEEAGAARRGLRRSRWSPSSG